MATTWPGAEPSEPPESKNSTLEALPADASKVVVFDRFPPVAGTSTLVLVGLLTVMPTPELKLLPLALNASETKV